ncbi:HAD domain-containing protein [Halopseudomonas pelagia]|uniref:Uncharacterized protein n=1 Tax=Halopseudomonas pelagia TaxID=553151 RepID=A0AA91Z7Z8_9GAMM|nr:HAD domain-containing protein [Halopseudomonas pelagia]PCD00966.1 hypothetical protein CO192_02670 [Halopseudomonas pelagia]QFY57606.1 hypothetical protein EAO82_15250 [Halopseudomonas pelagia]
MLLFLDYDGVLHPDAVYRRVDGQIELLSEGALFMWAPLLEELLQPFPEVGIVLSTSWVRNLGFQRAKGMLSAALAARLVGATWHSAMKRNSTDTVLWDQQSRYEQIATYLNRLGRFDSWLAIDDDGSGWPEDSLHRLVKTDGMLGISEARVRQEIISTLRR